MSSMRRFVCARRSRRASRPGYPRLETFELRRLLSTAIVDTLIDETVANSTTSLREAIGMAAAGDTIAFKGGLAGQIEL